MSIMDIVLTLLLPILISFVISYWFWKNPIDPSFRKETYITDKQSDDSELVYEIGYDHKGWKILKTILPSSIDGPIMKQKYYASAKNNPQIKDSPKDLEGIRSLRFD